MRRGGDAVLQQFASAFLTDLIGAPGWAEHLLHREAAHAALAQGLLHADAHHVHGRAAAVGGRDGHFHFIVLHLHLTQHAQLAQVDHRDLRVLHLIEEGNDVGVVDHGIQLHSTWPSLPGDGRFDRAVPKLRCGASSTAARHGRRCLRNTHAPCPSGHSALAAVPRLGGMSANVLGLCDGGAIGLLQLNPCTKAKLKNKC